MHVKTVAKGCTSKAMSIGKWHQLDMSFEDDLLGFREEESPEYFTRICSAIYWIKFHHN